jgi:hypothetical protein
MAPIAFQRAVIVRSALARFIALSLADVFNRVEVWTVGRQEQQRCSGRLDSISDTSGLVCGQIVHDDNIAWFEGGDDTCSS